MRERLGYRPCFMTFGPRSSIVLRTFARVARPAVSGLPPLMVDKKRKTSEQQDNVFPIFVKKTKHDDHSELSSLPGESVVRQRLTLKEFIRLLDFSSVTEEEDISSRMKDISNSLLHDILLVARKVNGKETEFEVLEAEFYLQIERIHEDPFTHGSEEQKFSGRW